MIDVGSNTGCGGLIGSCGVFGCIGVLLASVLLPLALFCIVLGLTMGPDLLQEYRMHSLPTAPGVIANSTVESKQTTINGRVETVYSPEITYRFEVNAKSYTSSQLSPLGLNSSRSWANEVVARYPIDKNVSVYYDPENPATSYLEPRIPKKIWSVATVIIGALLIMGIVVIGLAIATWRKLRS